MINIFHVENSLTSALILSYVPVEKPIAAINNIAEFLINKKAPGPSDVPHADINWITGGKTSANAVAQSAPINDMKRFNFGTSSAIETKILN